MKQALITGASSGIGLAIAKKLTLHDYAVTGIGRDFSEVDDTLMQPVILDLSDLDAVADAIKTQQAFKLAYDCVVLNAGYGHFGAIEQFSTDQIQQLINTNLTSALFFLRQLVPLMKQRKSGDIILIGSESALEGGREGAVYSATKFALRGIAQSLRKECANSGLRVMLINPGPVRSGFFDDTYFQPKAGERYAMQTEDIADAVLSCLQQPATTVIEEINLQPLVRSFEKK